MRSLPGFTTVRSAAICEADFDRDDRSASPAMEYLSHNWFILNNILLYVLVGLTLRHRSTLRLVPSNLECMLMRQPECEVPWILKDLAAPPGTLKEMLGRQSEKLGYPSEIKNG